MDGRKTVGIFDSGYGGLSVLSEALHTVKGADYLYYADTDHVPYGLRDRNEILTFTSEAVRFLAERGADAVILACNTASAVAAEKLRAEYDLPIIAMEPAVRPALQEEAAARILVTATPVTLREEKLKNLIRREHAQDRIDLLPMPDLVVLAEQEAFDAPQTEAYITQQLSDYDLSAYSAIVLGCTHFNYFKPLMRRILRETFRVQVHLIEGSAGTVRRAADLLSLTCVRSGKEGACGHDGDRAGILYFKSGRSVTEDAEKAHIASLLAQLERCRG